MRGEYKISVRNNRNSYTFTLKRNLTILRGESGRGKTTLYEMIYEYNRFGKNSGVSISCDRELLAVDGAGWSDTIASNPNKIIVIDEDSQFIRSEEFANVVKKSDNYFLLITRNYLSELPISVDEIYELTGGKNNKFKKIYTHIDRMFNAPLKEYLPFKPEVVVTEDSNSGFQFYNEIASELGIECISAHGKSNIFNIINNYADKNVVVIADSAAFGAEMGNIVAEQVLRPRKIAIFLPESFEWLILKSGIVDVESDQVEHPEKYADSQKYMSWERYFTDLLITTTKDVEYQSYSKKNLKEFYFKGKGREVIKSMIKGIGF